MLTYLFKERFFMEELPNVPSLKEINAYKSNVTWGDIPALYHMVSTSIGEVDTILTHGFQSPFKDVLNPKHWNLPALEGHIDKAGKTHIKIKPQIILHHKYTDMGYELHCYPIIDGVPLTTALVNNRRSPFKNWHPEFMQRLFRVSSFVNFCTQAYQNGDEADFALIKYAFLSVQKHIETLNDSFDVVDVKGYNIAQFYQQINLRHGEFHT
jgi:hypothetical protein